MRQGNWQALKGGRGASADGAGPGGWLVPASSDWGQILDAQIGGFQPLWVGGLGGQYMSRELAASYATVFRCVTLLSAMIADLISQSARVVDRDGRTIKTRTAHAVLDLLRESPDGMLSAYQWIEDYATDYLMDGNALGVVERGGGRPIKIRLQQPWDSDVESTEFGYVYHSRDDGGAARETTAALNMCHARWPRIGSRGSDSRRRFFALAPILVLQNSIGTGISADQWIRGYFATNGNGGYKGGVSINYEEVPDPEQQERVVESIRQYMASQNPLVTFGKAAVNSLKDSPQDADALKLREYQVRDIGTRLYGCPAPILGENVTQWGSGIEQLARLLYRFGGKHHLQRVMTALGQRLLPRGQGFAINELLINSGDLKTLSDLIRAISGQGGGRVYATPEEIRSLIGLQPEGAPEGASDPAPMLPPGGGGLTPWEPNDKTGSVPANINGSVVSHA